MSGPTPAAVFALLRSQLLFHPIIPTSTFDGQTVIITGSNSGLGREAAKQIVHLGAARVVLGVRNKTKGEAAKSYIESQTQQEGIVDVWELDMSSWASVRAFVHRANTLIRLDAVIANAGIWPTRFETCEGHETTITVNVLSTILLARLILPKLQATALTYQTTSRLTIVSSALHKFAKLAARADPAIFEVLKQETNDYDMRYQDSKLLLHLYFNQLSPQLHTSDVCLNLVNPGYCKSELKPPKSFAERSFERLLARSTDEGAATLVDAASLNDVDNRRGAYVDDMTAKCASPWLQKEEGRDTSERVWNEVNSILGIENIRV